MAAWLAYLKSRLLRPETEDGDEPTGAYLAAALAFRLQRLEAMREAGARLMNRNRLGRNRFARGRPEPVVTMRSQNFDANLYDLLEAYGSMRQRQLVSTVHITRRSVMTLKEARERLMELIGTALDWMPIDRFLTDYVVAPELRISARASSLSASLEMVKEGKVELRQGEPFAPLYLRKKIDPAKIFEKSIATGTDDA
jgi:segregation and condensation protein A